MRPRLAVAALAISSALLAADAPAPVLRIPGSPDRPIDPTSLLGAARMDVRVEESAGDVTVYHGLPLLEVIEKAGVETKTMAGQRRLSSAVVLVSARDGYTAAFTVGELLMHRGDPRVYLVAETAQGPLPENQGPIRAVVLGDRARSPYALARVELRYLAENPAEKKK